MKSPFKFLDSYTKEDRDIFFGREREIEELYRRVFDSKIMLVYGVSGTGKSSLIHCGLANKFQETDWLPLVIRRGSNVLDSMAEAIKEASITPQPGEIQTALQFKKAIRSLYLDHYKPVFFIFDQFEELFIFGNKEEDENFIKVLKVLLSADIQCKFIFILREEYLGWLSTFERSINGFFDNRMRVEKMDIGNARKSIDGPCKVFNIELEDGFADKMLEKLCPPKESEIELTYLQVYLDKIFKLATEYNKDKDNKITFRISDLDKAGNVYDILGSFLDEQISNFPDPEQVMTVLKAFVSAKGTKRPSNVAEVREYALATGKDIDEKAINALLISLVNLRILQDKDHSGRNELKHDALAAKIFEKITLLEKELIEIRQLIENAYNSWQKRGVLVSADDLQYIAPYESRLYLPEDYASLIEKSKKKLVKARHRRRNLLSAAAVLLFIILGAFTIWAIKERNNAVVKEKIANEEKLKASASEEVAIKARDNAIESDLKAVASAQEALKARDEAKESESRALFEKTIAEKREIQARANNFNFLSKEVATEDPTIALRIAEYALKMDPQNKVIISNLNRIYYDNSFYRILFKGGVRGSFCQISPDWTRIVTASGRTAILSDINGENSKLLIGHVLRGLFTFYVHGISRAGYDNINAIEFSPDGNQILTGSEDFTARLWDLNGNTLQIFKGHAGPVYSVSFSPDQKTILTGSEDGTAVLWNLNGVSLQKFIGHRSSVYSVAFSPDGKTILTGSNDSSAIMWDLDGRILQKFRGHLSAVTNAVFSPDGMSVLTGSRDQTARLWDLNGNTLQIFRGHLDNVGTVGYSPDGTTILTGSSDKTARLWDLNGNNLQTFIGHNGSVYSVSFSPDGKKILTCSTDGNSRIWDISQGETKNYVGHKDGVYRAVFSPDGKSFLTSSKDYSMRLWDTYGNKSKVFHQISADMVFSPDGKTILTVFTTAQFLDLNGKILATFTGQSPYIRSAAFSPDGQTFMTGSDDGTARIWDLHGVTLQILSGHTKGINCVAFSPDGKMVLTGSKDNTARLWDLNGNTLTVFNGHTDFLNSAIFSPDGKTVLTASDDNYARLWDLKGNTIQVFDGHTNDINQAVFSQDNRYILTGSSDETARLWDLKGNTLQILRGYKSPVNTVAFSPDGRIILTGSDEKTVRLTMVKPGVDFFLKENLSEELNLEQKLQYQIIQIDQLNGEKETDRIIQGLKFCLLKAKMKDNNEEYYLDKCTSLLKKLEPRLTNQKVRIEVISDGLDMLTLRSDMSVNDLVEKANEMFLSSADKEGIKEAYEFYSYINKNLDTVKISMKLPEIMIQISNKLLTADTSSKYTISCDLTNLSWRLVQNGKYDSSLEAIKLAVKCDSTNQYCYIMLPLALVVNNKLDEAIPIYKKYYKAFIYKNLAKQNQLFYLEDISYLEQRGIKHPDFATVKELLKK